MFHIICSFSRRLFVIFSIFQVIRRASVDQEVAVVAWVALQAAILPVRHHAMASQLRQGQETKAKELTPRMPSPTWPAGQWRQQPSDKL